jgi:hypothetical protein
MIAARIAAGMRVVRAALAPFAGARGGYARVECSRRIQRRTVVVWLDFPAEPGASLRQAVWLVARERRGYRVWALLH